MTQDVSSVFLKIIVKIMKTKLRQITYNIARFLPITLCVLGIIAILLGCLLPFSAKQGRETASAYSASDVGSSVHLSPGTLFLSTSSSLPFTVTWDVPVPVVNSYVSFLFYYDSDLTLEASTSYNTFSGVFCLYRGVSEHDYAKGEDIEGLRFFVRTSESSLTSYTFTGSNDLGMLTSPSSSEPPSYEGAPSSSFVSRFLNCGGLVILRDVYVSSVFYSFLNQLFTFVSSPSGSSSDSYDEGYQAGYSDGLSKGETTSFTNPVAVAFEPVTKFLNTPFFGGSLTLGSVLSVVLFVAVALIFLKMFAGG